MPQIKIDCTKIPRIACKLIFRALTKEMERFYSNPINFERFEQWKKSRDEEEKALCE